MKKYLVVVMTVMLLCIGCGNTDTPDTEANTQQTEIQSETENVVTSEVDTETTEVNTETESEITTEEETETQTESETPSEELQAPTYTYTDLDKTMYAKSSVNVRDLPSTEGNKLGGLSKAQEVHVTGQCNETGWYRISYNGSTGYVSNNYLQDSKPVEETPSQPQQPTQSSEPENTADNTTDNTQNEVCPYELYVIYYDNQGYPYFYGKWGGPANMDADNLAKTDACKKQMDNYVVENFKVIADDGNWTESHITSWQYIGTYQGTEIVVRYIESCNGVSLGSPETRGIPTAGNGK